MGYGVKNVFDPSCCGRDRCCFRRKFSWLMLYPKFAKFFGGALALGGLAVLATKAVEKK